MRTEIKNSSVGEFINIWDSDYQVNKDSLCINQLEHLDSHEADYCYFIHYLSA